ncbi:GGDEF domain-containing protein [Hydrogenimonas sp. SS33]|uniref:EAL domain-containing protein n=1 Tax=Hydrogenimonas leucolamina TaxID=2954236 RepID=UPI00336BE51F
MLYSEIAERSRRFRLALRMGIPILLLIAVVIFYIVRHRHIEIAGIDIAIFALILFISIYFLFFLINLGQSETVTDRMTGAFNRKHLITALKERMSENGPYSVILFRIDNLPFINDHYGIDRGDRLLRVFVHLFDGYLKMQGVKEAVIGRYHGGDFIVGMPMEAEKSLALVDSFVSTYREIDGITVEYKYAGVEKMENTDIPSLITYLYDTLSQQKSQADKRKREEKRLDINRLEEDIVEAIEAGRLRLHYIPSMNLQSGTVDLFEVGVRLETRENGILPPKKFIPAVNRLGLENRFDTALFEAVCRDAKRVGPPIRFSFNISPFSLRNERFVQSVKEIAGQEGVPFERLILELYENRAVKDVSRYRLILEELRSLGFGFALDNFGGSNASFEYVKSLPVDMVQFDREFTISYNNPRIAALMKGYITAFRSMGVQTLVKWVDSEEAYRRFKQLGVDYAQGFFISNRPYDSETLIKKYGVKDAIR